jgi:signal peptidase I
MEPTLAKGDLVLVRPAREIERGDLIVFSAPMVGTRMIKRVVALGGDVIELRDNRAFVNGAQLDEPYVAPNDDSLPAPARFRDMQPARVAADSVFVLGDNRDHSNDSRFLGAVPRKSVRGRVVFVISKRSGIWRP